MKMAEISSGPDWIAWILVIFLGIISVTLLLGRGSWFISGYNVASKEEKAKYDEKKLCRTYGMGMSIITILVFVTILFEDVLPAEFAYIEAAGILVVVLVMAIFVGTVCKK